MQQTRSIYSQGIILVVVMIYLVILSLLALGALEASTLQSRMSNNIKDGNRLFICAESLLSKGKEILVSSLSKKCVLTEQVSDYYHNKSARWWEANACKMHVCHDYKTFYLIEKLSEQPCYKIGSYPAGARYYRMTVRTSYYDNSYQTVLQSTILMPYISSDVCPLSKIEIHTGGQQSWKQIM